MRVKCLILLILGYGNLTLAQTVLEQPYTIINISPKTNFSKYNLNKKISKAKSKQEVKEILWKIIDLQNVEINIRIYKGNGKYAWWILNKRKTIDREGDWILTQSKYSEAERINSTSELMSILKDTLAVLDTLKLNLYLRDESLPIDQYYVFLSCNNTSVKHALPYIQNSILITQLIEPNCPNKYRHISLHNESRPQMFLGECEVCFLNDDIKATLKDLAISLKETNDKMEFKVLVDYISVYIKRNYGKVSQSAITNLLIRIPELNK